MNWIDNSLGLHAKALSFRSQRSAALASNIANADTPGYKARDYDFRTALNSVADGGRLQMNTTHAKHAVNANNDSFGELLYRMPTKPMYNGNSVEAEVEQAAFARNALEYQASLEFLNGSISGLRLAIKGQR
jgi:flagellar basal-body rod protein FlgB